MAQCGNAISEGLIMSKIIIYTSERCPYCQWAKEFFDAKKLSYDEIRIDLDPQKREEAIRLSGRRTVPQIIINDRAIGGYDDLIKLSKSGELQTLLEK